MWKVSFLMYCPLKALVARFWLLCRIFCPGGVEEKHTLWNSKVYKKQMMRKSEGRGERKRGRWGWISKYHESQFCATLPMTSSTTSNIFRGSWASKMARESPQHQHNSKATAAKIRLWMKGAGRKCCYGYMLCSGSPPHTRMPGAAASSQEPLSWTGRCKLAILTQCKIGRSHYKADLPPFLTPFLKGAHSKVIWTS